MRMIVVGDQEVGDVMGKGLVFGMLVWVGMLLFEFDFFGGIKL
jgi:hypothetical protein